VTAHILQQLIQEPILHIQELDPGYMYHASDVWRVETAIREVVVRRSRLTEEPSREFWWGCLNLFGIDPRRLSQFEANAKLLSSVPDIPVPEVLRRAVIDGREYLVVEKMSGMQLQSFKDQSSELLHQLGAWLAKVHAIRYDEFGNLAGTRTEKRELFHQQLAQTIEQLVVRDCRDEPKIAQLLGEMLQTLSGLSVPEHLCPILVDMDPSQFLTQDGMISAIVDVEAYAVAPRELDFIGLEYVLDEPSSQAFMIGYSTVLDIPDIYIGC
jgi:aminoglycoside phosphotransferase (APT) family kinase protein